ncbi:MBL fold metallo-hydrolase [Rummeliibacillus sp. TYF005]|uniref:MBL fold metallo-hydrolase n=1 Tax=Rummeliibacillus sp. TYF005 TaxID=2058214 RepID=UPI000F534081|nr:MBL fold metallo-hydrolase [Rummeliibacillus sp. TYF005]RPJ94486.1 MBL fold metallo-hydrolase [Rummeliibacillus sp. TYF005]
MLIKKKIKMDNTKGVNSINGVLSFQGVILNVHCFVSDGVLIDTGGKRLLKHFAPFLLEQDYDQVWITHHHEDHTGGAAFIENTIKVPIYIHKKSLDAASNKPDYPLYRQLFWGRRKSFHANPFSDTMPSRNSMWEIIETPGHTKDHLAFLNRQTGQLFTGDLYVTPKTKVIMQSESIPTIIKSLEKVIAYQFDDVFCQHSGYVEDGRRMLAAKKEYLEEIQHKILTLHKSGFTIKEIQKQLFPQKYAITKFSSGDWDSIHIINSVIFDQN